MQELRLVAVSEDGSYAVLVVPGRSGRFALPIDERLRTVARGQFSRLAQYEIEVESPLRPKEIQDRIRAGETAEEIADAAGLPVDRIRRFEGPVLAEREFRAGEAQRATVRGPGELGAGLRLGEVVTERLSEFGIVPEDQDWDSRKRQDGNWQVQLAYTVGGRMHVAEWVYDPRSKHVTPEDDEAIRLCLDESQWPGPRQAPPQPMTATVTPIGSRAAAGSHPSSASHPVAAPSTLVTHPSEHRGDSDRHRSDADRSAGRNLLHPGRHAQATVQASQPTTAQPVPAQPVATQPVATQPVATQPVATQPVELGPFAGSQEGPEPGADSGTPAAKTTPAGQEPARREQVTHESARPEQASQGQSNQERANQERPNQERPQAPAKSTAAADAKEGQPDQAPEQPEQPEHSEQPEESEQPSAPQSRPAKRSGSRSRRSSVPSWDEIMFGNSRQPD